MNSESDARSLEPVQPREVVLRPDVGIASFSAPDALGLIRSLHRRGKLATGLGCLAALFAAGVAYVIVPPAKYSAQAMLHVASEQPRILIRTSEAVSDYASYQRTQLAMLRSRMVLGAALKQPDVAKLDFIKREIEPVEWLDKQLKIDFAENSEILRIGMNGTNPTEPALVVNAVVQAYLDEVVNVEVRQRRERADMLKEVWNRYQETLRVKRDEVRRLSMAAGSDDKQALALLRLNEAEQLAKADAELGRTRDELRRLKVEFEVLQRNKAGSRMAPALVAEQIEKDPTVVSLNNQVERARTRYEQARQSIREGSDPSIRALASTLESARLSLNAQRNALRPTIAMQLEQQNLGSNLATDGLRQRIEILEGLEQLQAEDARRLMDRTRSTTQASVDLNASREEIFHADELARKIGSEVETLNLELQAPVRVRLRERAEASHTKDEMKQIKTSGAAALGAFALALFGVSFWEFQARRIYAPRELTQSLGVQIVGTLPALPRGRGEKRKLTSFQSLMIEAVDAARASVIHAARDRPVNVVMVASAVGGEGKTSLACHLAASMARSGRETLLIDCDLRRPSANRVLDLPGETGVSEILRGEIAPEDAILTTSANHLWFLPAGRCSPEALQALSRDEIGALFAILRHRFDTIVVDTPPVLPVADALHIGQHVDAALFAVMRDLSRLPNVQTAYDRLASLGIRMLGAVVAGVRSDMSGSEYYYAASHTDRA